MTKTEFLSVLRGQITGRIPTSEVEAQIDYYSAYIDGRIGSGMTEEEVLAELGDPRLIAKTVVESVDRAAEAAGYDGRYRSSTDTYDDSDGINSGIFGSSTPRGAETGYDTNQGSASSAGGSAGYSQGGAQTRSTGAPGQNRPGSTLGCIVSVIVVVLILAALWIIFTFVLRLTVGMLGWLFPVLAVAAVIALIVSLVKRK